MERVLTACLDHRIVACASCDSVVTRPIVYGRIPRWLQPAVTHGLLTHITQPRAEHEATRECLDCGNCFVDMVPMTQAQFVTSAFVVLESFKRHWTDLVLAYGLACELQGAASNLDDGLARDLGHRAHADVYDLWGILEATAQPFCHSFLTRNMVPFYGDRCVYTPNGILELARFEEALIKSPQQLPYLPSCVVCSSHVTVPLVDEAFFGECPDEFPLLWRTVSRAKGDQSNRSCCECNHAWLDSRELPVTADQLADPMIVLFRKFRPGLEGYVVAYGAACLKFAIAPLGSDDQAAAHRDRMQAFASAVAKWQSLFDDAQEWGLRPASGGPWGPGGRNVLPPIN